MKNGNFVASEYPKNIILHLYCFMYEQPVKLYRSMG